MRIELGLRRKTSIPKFYNIRKYDECKKWDAHLWLEAFDYRLRLVRSWNSLLKRELDSNDAVSIYSDFKNHAEDLLTNPTGRRSIFGYKNIELVKDITARSLFGIEIDDIALDSPWFGKFKIWKDIGCEGRRSRKLSDMYKKGYEETPSWVIMRDVYGVPNWAGLEVNMFGSDEDIKSAFSDWLRKTRKSMNIKNPNIVIDSKTLNGWYEDRVLPCFDLMLYEEFFNVRFKQSNFYRALFYYLPRPQSDVENSEKLRKTFIPRSLHVISDTTVVALESYLKKIDPLFEKYRPSFPDLPSDIFLKTRA